MENPTTHVTGLNRSLINVLRSNRAQCEPSGTPDNTSNFSEINVPTVTD